MPHAGSGQPLLQLEEGFNDTQYSAVDRLVNFTCTEPGDDGGVTLPPDAGTDAGMPPADAGEPDAGEPDAGEPDAGTPIPDAGTPPPDAGTPPPDAGTPTDGEVLELSCTTAPQPLAAFGEDTVSDRSIVICNASDTGTCSIRSGDPNPNQCNGSLPTIELKVKADGSNRYLLFRSPLTLLEVDVQSARALKYTQRVRDR